MQQKLDWLRRFLHSPEPRIEHLATYWKVRGPSNRDLTCSAYKVQTGLELRVEYGPEDIVASWWAVTSEAGAYVPADTADSMTRRRAQILET